MSEMDVNVISASPVKQPIIENAVYEREEAIAITGFSLSTLVRAEKSGGERDGIKADDVTISVAIF